MSPGTLPGVAVPGDRQARISVQRNLHPLHRDLCLGLVSTLEIAMGFICFIAQWIDTYTFSKTAAAATGIWSGAFFMATGGLGVALVLKKQHSTCMMKTFAGMSLSGSVLSAAPIIAGGFGVRYATSPEWTIRDHDIVLRSLVANMFLLVSGIVNAVLMMISFLYVSKKQDSYEQQVVGAPSQHQLNNERVHQPEMIFIPVSQFVVGGQLYQSSLPASLPGQQGPQGPQVYIINTTSPGLGSVLTQGFLPAPDQPPAYETL